MWLLAALLGILLALCLGVLLVGKVAQGRLAKSSPGTMVLHRITPLGLAWHACFVAYLLAIPATYYLMPDTWLAAFLGNWYGVPVAFALGLLFFTAGGTALELAGFRMGWRREGR
jgi:hypothetical protein